MFYGGFGSFTSDSTSGNFQVNVVDPYAGGSFSPRIITPAGSLSFLLGSGTPSTYPFGPFGDLLYGVQYTGTFSSTSAVYGDLLSGLGVFQLSSDSGVVLSGTISTVPEPSTITILLFGAAVWSCSRRGQGGKRPRTPHLIRPINPINPEPEVCHNSYRSI